MKKIAIIGAGFCGLAVAWQLYHHGQVTLFDFLAIGEGTSGMASGLLHPFVGTQSKLNWMGREGYQATVKLLKVAEEALKRPIISPLQGILRLALDEEQIVNFQNCAHLHPDVKWMDTDETQEKIPGIVKAPGIFITNGLTVYSSHYLQGLWQACQANGVGLEKAKINTLAELEHYDLVIITAGALTQQIPELEHLPLNQLKGQLLELQWPPGLPPLTCALNSYVYLLMSENNQSCVVGGTYERGFAHAGPDIEKAKQELLPKLKTMFPLLQDAPILACRAGIRSGASQRLPFIKQVGPKHWVLAGMGSKGLLYHALMAEQLADKIRNSVLS